MSKKWIALLLIGVVLAVAVLYMINPKLFSNIWIWLIGLSGTAIGWLKGAFSGFGGERIQALSTENAKLREQLEGLSTRIDKADKELAIQREQHTRAMADLDRKLAQKQEAFDKALKDAERLAAPEPVFTPAEQEIHDELAQRFIPL